LPCGLASLDWRPGGVVEQDVEHGRLDLAVAGYDLTVIGVKLAAVVIGDRGARFKCDQGTPGNIPRRDAALPVAVQTTRGDVAQIQSRGAKLTRALDPDQKRLPDRRLPGAVGEVVGEAGRHHRPQ